MHSGIHPKQKTAKSNSAKGGSVRRLQALSIIYQPITLLSKIITNPLMLLTEDNEFFEFSTKTASVK